MIGLIAKLLVTLNNNSRPGEMASAISFGFWLALIPGGNLLWTLLFTIAFFLKHNTAAFLLSLGAFRLFVPLADPLLHMLGDFILNLPGLKGFFTSIYNLPFAAYSNFNNTVVMGAFLAGSVLWIPLYLLFRFLVNLYRKKAAPKIADSKWMKALKKIPFISKIGKAVNLEAGL